MLDIGVLEDSVRYYHEVDDFTKDYLYYIPHAGSYHCNHEYEVSRTYLDICQIILVDSGELEVTYRGKTSIAPAGSVVLLDCREPHRYRAASADIKIRWFHFAGHGSKAYTQQILDTIGVIIGISPNAEIESCISSIIKMVGLPDHNAHILSVTIHQLLALLPLLFSEAPKSDIEQAIESSADYIETHYSDPELSNQKLARMCMLSTCYYIRKFKEQRSMTPHQFVQSVRIRMAKQKLTTTSLSIEEIAMQCGFCSTSHFIMAFRKSTNITPMKYRAMWK